MIPSALVDKVDQKRDSQTTNRASTCNYTFGSLSMSIMVPTLLLSAHHSSGELIDIDRRIQFIHSASSLVVCFASNETRKLVFARLALLLILAIACYRFGSRLASQANPVF